MKSRKVLPITLAVLLPSVLLAGEGNSGPDPNAAAQFWSMKIGDVIMILAVFLAPIFALWAQWQLQLRQAKRQQRMNIYSTLMATRLTALDADHVKALNMIDVVFSGKDQDVEIRNAWATYLTHLNVPLPPINTPENQQWHNHRVDLLSTLLSKMGKSLGYDFEFTDYKNRVYQPSGLADNSNEMIEIRKRWLDIVRGDKALKMEVTAFPGNVIPPAPFH